MFIKKVFIVVHNKYQQDDSFIELERYLKKQYQVDFELKSPYDVVLEYDETTLTLLYMGDTEIKFFLKNHLSSNMNIGILPMGENPKAVASYGISNDIYEACDDCFDTSRLNKVDILLCNGEPTFTNIIIGDVHGLNNASIEKQNIFTNSKEFLLNIFNLSFKDFTITTAKEQVVQTAATGLMVLEHNVKHGKYNLLNEEFSLHDGKMNAFILAPTSVLAYLYYLFIVFFCCKISINSLPKSIGIIKTSFLKITSSRPIDFKLDGVLMSAKELDLEIKKDTLNIVFGRNIINLDNNNVIEDEKETIKTASLPKGDIKHMLINEPLPFFKKASEDDFKELFLSLKESSKISSIFIILMVLSTLLATTGLFQSSAPVIIGAMILAPLMSPIVSLSMGVVRAEEILIKHSAKTLFIGVLTALFFSCLYTYFMPLSVLTDEMRGRVNPNLLDLMVAILSGIAGAYANSKSEVAKSLAGVAIAVALVPPLSVTGIGIGWGDVDIIYGSFLLFITNLVGITLFASLTFVILGYAPITRAKKGLLYSLLILAVVMIPLAVSFSKVIKQNSILKQLNHKHYIVNSKNIEVDILEVDLSKTQPIIFIQTKSNKLLTEDDLKSLNQKISYSVKEEVILNVDTRTIVYSKE